MIKAIKISLVFILCWNVQQAIAQPMKTVDYNTKLMVADQAASEGDYYGAIEWYTKAFEESKDLNLQLAIADLYILARDFAKAEKIYDRILKRDKKKEYEDIRIDYARSLKSQGKYRDALKEFNTILEDAESTDSLKSLARFELKGIEMMDNLAPNLEAIVNYLPGKVNSGSAETSPAVGPDGSLYFSSFNRKKKSFWMDLKRITTPKSIQLIKMTKVNTTK